MQGVPTGVDVSSAAGGTLLQYGVIGVCTLVLALVVRHLYSRLNKKDDEFAAERRAWDAERIKSDHAHEMEMEKLRTSFERSLKENAEAYAKTVREDRADSRAREDMVRKEFSDLMETIATKAAESSDATKQVLDKIYQRFIGPRKGGGAHY